MRSKSRECAFKVIFSEEFEGGGESRRAVYRASELDEEETEYADRLVSLVEEHREELSAVLDKFSIGFSETRYVPRRQERIAHVFGGNFICG